MEGRKQTISIRLSATDLRNLRKLARRVGVRNSDVLRFALKSSIARLAPLLEAETKGRDLVPVFVEVGPELVRYLDLDATRIEAIINDGTGEPNRVDRADIQLLAGASPLWSRLRLSDTARLRALGTLPAENEELLPSATLRRYFYDKYVYEPQGAAGVPFETQGAQS